jgi:hypothetical protein
MRDVRVELLYVAGCPNAARLADWMAAELAGRPATTLVLREVADAAEAEAAGMTGSPTLLVDGWDPFAVPGTPPSLSCRLFPDGAGGLAGLPSTNRLRDALGLPERDQPDP